MHNACSMQATRVTFVTLRLIPVIRLQHQQQLARQREREGRNCLGLIGNRYVVYDTSHVRGQQLSTGRRQ